jgi:hypothetical protein
MSSATSKSYFSDRKARSGKETETVSGLESYDLDNFRGRRLAIFRCCDDLEKIASQIDQGDGGRSLDAGTKIDAGHRNELINQIRVLKRTMLLWNDGRVEPVEMKAY